MNIYGKVHRISGVWSDEKMNISIQGWFTVHTQVGVSDNIKRLWLGQDLME